MRVVVKLGSDESRRFIINTRVRKKCIFALAMFSLLLGAMLEVMGEGPSKRIYINTISDGGLNNLRCQKAKLKVREVCK